MIISFDKYLVLVVAITLISNIACVSNSTIPFSKENRDVLTDIILEVTTESKNMVYPPGTVTNIKLFSSGLAEYDHYPKPDTNVSFKVERRKVQLEEGEFEKAKNLLANLGNTTLKAEYEPTVRIFDASIVTKVKYAKSNGFEFILLKENHSNLILEKKKGIYPEPLLDLMLFVKEFDQRVLER
jgi:hypothetical protein